MFPRPDVPFLTADGAFWLGQIIQGEVSEQHKVALTNIGTAIKGSITLELTPDVINGEDFSHTVDVWASHVEAEGKVYLHAKVYTASLRQRDYRGVIKVHVEGGNTVDVQIGFDVVSPSTSTSTKEPSWLRILWTSFIKRILGG